MDSGKEVRRINYFYMHEEGDVPYREITLKCGEKLNVYTITDPNVLGLYVGYGKYINRYGYNVYMRGQSGIYGGSMVPSLLRAVAPGNSNPVNANKLVTNLKTIMNTISKKSQSMNDYSQVVLEPLLQHYGMKTTMIDLVDNLWIALWFGLYTAKTEIVGGIDGGTEHVYYVPRESVKLEQTEAGELAERKQYAYIYLMATDAVTECLKYGRRKSDNKYSGIYEGEETRAVDLRKAFQPRFLRPHAQHGIMIQKLNQEKAMDYSDLIVGIAEIPVELGQKWMGNSSLLNVSSLFPSAVYDSGYRDLSNAVRECGLKQNVKMYGSIQFVNGT